MDAASQASTPIGQAVRTEGLLTNVSVEVARPLPSALPFRVWQNMSPPRAERLDPASYAGFPLTDVICRHPSAAHSRCAELRISQLVWDNRALLASDGTTRAWNPKPNPLCLSLSTTEGLECRAQFSTQAKAMAATLVQLSHACGASAAKCRELALSAGFSGEDIIPWADLTCDESALNRIFVETRHAYSVGYAVSLDKIILAPWRLPDCINGDIWGMIVDLEGQDGRSEADQFEHIGRLVTTAHAAGLKTGFFMNALNGELSRRFNGCTPDVLYAMHQRADMIWLALGSKNPERGGSVRQQWANQLEEFGGGGAGVNLDFSKLGVNFELGVSPGGTTIQDARDAHSIIATNALGGGVWPWRNGARLGPYAAASTVEKLRVLYGG